MENKYLQKIDNINKMKIGYDDTFYDFQQKFNTMVNYLELNNKIDEMLSNNNIVIEQSLATDTTTYKVKKPNDIVFIPDNIEKWNEEIEYNLFTGVVFNSTDVLYKQAYLSDEMSLMIVKPTSGNYKVLLLDSVGKSFFDVTDISTTFSIKNIYFKRLTSNVVVLYLVFLNGNDLKYIQYEFSKNDITSDTLIVKPLTAQYPYPYSIVNGISLNNNINNYLITNTSSTNYIIKWDSTASIIRTLTDNNNNDISYSSYFTHFLNNNVLYFYTKQATTLRLNLINNISDKMESTSSSITITDYYDINFTCDNILIPYTTLISNKIYSVIIDTISLKYYILTFDFSGGNYIVTPMFDFSNKSYKNNILMSKFNKDTYRDKLHCEIKKDNKTGDVTCLISLNDETCGNFIYVYNLMKKTYYVISDDTKMLFLWDDKIMWNTKLPIIIDNLEVGYNLTSRITPYNELSFVYNKSKLENDDKIKMIVIPFRFKSILSEIYSTDSFTNNNSILFNSNVLNKAVFHYQLNKLDVMTYDTQSIPFSESLIQNQTTLI